MLRVVVRSTSGWYFILWWVVPYVLMGCLPMLLGLVPYVLVTGTICYGGCYLMFWLLVPYFMVSPTFLSSIVMFSFKRQDNTG